ncbi:MAG: hypothetical protein M5U12_12870 [Verrucomicrobia bacterium]|nr:hypothetical protein [Verrucomicrobiota bacterium]
MFQTVQQGAHYLAAGSPYRNWSAALTTIDSGLLQDLRQLTTYPPVALTSDFAVSTTLSPQAQRDVDTMDLGYHYLVSGRKLTILVWKTCQVDPMLDAEPSKLFSVPSCGGF